MLAKNQSLILKININNWHNYYKLIFAIHHNLFKIIINNNGKILIESIIDNYYNRFLMFHN